MITVTLPELTVIYKRKLVMRQATLINKGKDESYIPITNISVFTNKNKLHTKLKLGRYFLRYISLSY